jgi:xanthine dehydrogenase accessory factor
MLVTRNSCAGTIGGGHLELEALALARSLIDQEGARDSHINLERLAGQDLSVTQHFSLGPSLGQCCGGAVDLQFELVNPSMLTIWPDDELRFTLALFGAGHVGRAIADALSLLPCRLIWIDEREHEFPKPALVKSSIEVRCVDTPSAEIKALPSGCFVIVTTHSHDLDLEVCEAALNRTDLGFIGLIGSATKKARFLKRLEQKSVTGKERLVCPIGMSSILGKEPQVIAASVAAQLLELSYKKFT